MFMCSARRLPLCELWINSLTSWQSLSCLMIVLAWLVEFLWGKVCYSPDKYFILWRQTACKCGCISGHNPSTSKYCQLIFNLNHTRVSIYKFFLTFHLLKSFQCTLNTGLFWFSPQIRQLSAMALEQSCTSSAINGREL